MLMEAFNFVFCLIVVCITLVLQKKWKSLVTSYFQDTRRKTIRKIDFSKLLDKLFQVHFQLVLFQVVFEDRAYGLIIVKQ